MSTIIYTKTDEAPALATYSFLPIVKAFTDAAGINVETRDISLAGRLLANFPENLAEGQRQHDALAELGELAKSPEANIIKLPNISASIPQLVAAIEELQSQGFDIPSYPEEPSNDAEQAVRDRYASVLGSAVNPVLREGNSDRRVALAVKNFAKANPHRMGAWSADSKSHVAHMEDGDFFSTEQSAILANAGNLHIEHTDADGNVTMLRKAVPVLEGEVVDASVMNCKALSEFFAKEIDAAKNEGVLFSLHLKATMMKVSDPIMFGHCVRAYYSDVFNKHEALFNEIGVDANNGIGDVYAKIEGLSAEARVRADLEAVYKTRPEQAMVDSDKGITNLHVPSNVIIDASMPAAIRSSGQMWGPDGRLHDAKMVIPDRCYASIYQEVIQDCKDNGAFDVATMGNVCNVGLMAQKAEEYGSHDKTFEIAADGKVTVTDQNGDVVMEHVVNKGDIWRMCQAKDLPIRDWVKLAVMRARATGSAAIFWLNENRAHDRNLIELVNKYLADHDTEGLDIRIESPVDAMRSTLKRVRAGKDTISVTGNVLRDYLTDLFPILELGTSAKMLSIEDVADKSRSEQARIIAEALNEANGRYLEENRAPSRKVNEIDNRGSHYFLARYWAEAVAANEDDAGLAEQFKAPAQALIDNEEKILAELLAAQGKPVNIGGYYRPDDELATAAMRPSTTLNAIINLI